VEVVNDPQQVPTNPAGHLQGKSAVNSTEPAPVDKAKKGGA
jgi:multidrug efflux system membrane fusion protein